MKGLNTTNHPLVYVIIVNWNGLEHLPECLGSLRALDYPNFKTVVVDNRSQDGSQELVRTTYPEVELLENRSNQGFAKGNNRGMRYALDRGADYVALLNNDTVVDPAWLSELVRVAQGHDDVGAVASKMVSYRSPSTINSAGACMTLTCWGYDRGLGEGDRQQYDREEEVFSACGGAMLINPRVLDRVGLFDPRLFMCFEDVDLCWRMRLMGYRILYVPTAVVRHKWGGSMHANSPQRFFYCERNRLRNMIKNYRPKSLAVALQRSFIIDVKLMTQFFHEDERIRNHARACLKGYLWNLIFLRDTLSCRWRVQRRRILSDEAALAKADRVFGYPGATGDNSLSFFDPPLSVRIKHCVKTYLPWVTRALRAVFPKKA